MATVKRKNFQRFDGSLKVSQLPEEIILGEKSIKSYETPGSCIDIAQSEDKKLYVVTVAYWGGDEADDWHHGFEKLDSAIECFNYYRKPISQHLAETKRQRMVTSIKGEAKKTMPGTTYQDKYIVQSLYGGDYLKPFFDRDLLEEKGLIEKAKQVLEAGEDVDIREIISDYPELAECLLVLGISKFGKTITIEPDGDAPITELTTKEINFVGHYCWETGITYYELATRLPKDIFSKLKLWYHNEQIEEEGEWKGWCIGKDSESGLEQLKNEGWTITYLS